MDRGVLAGFLAEGLSLAEIGARVGKHESTVGYWVAKHGLEPVNRDRHAPRGGIARDVLVALSAEGLSLRGMARQLDVSLSTVRHWMRKYELETPQMRRIKAAREARAAGLVAATLPCPRHGETLFRQMGDGRFRCVCCSSDAVTEHRRRTKQRLVEDAGGGCAVCGYNRYAGALHFHHLNPAEKKFELSRRGVTRSLAEAQAEARKCALLCGNCHAEVGAGILTLEGGGGKV